MKRRHTCDFRSVLQQLYPDKPIVRLDYEDRSEYLAYLEETGEPFVRGQVDWQKK
jgi:hypothetical protein